MDWSQKDLDRFWSKVKKTQGCWEWTGQVASHGYGRFTRGRKWEDTAHRIAYAMSYGPVPKGLVVRHRCDNRLCCNPVHLELGSQTKNVQDMWERNRRETRLTLKQAIEIRERALAGERGIDLAAEFGVTPSTVSVIKLGKRWKEEYHLGH